MSTNNQRFGTLQPMGSHRVEGLLPESVLAGWRKQRKELEKRVEQEKAYQATQAEALRKAQKTRDVPPSTLPPPTLDHQSHCR